MTEPTHPTLSRVAQVVDALGPVLIDQVTLVGGSRQALLPLPTPIRPTLDVDLVLPTTGPLDWHHYVAQMEERGFVASSDVGAPICRYQRRRSGTLLVVDVMPTDARLGFVNRWYLSACEHRVPLGIVGLFGSSPLDHLLTKIEAYEDRGAEDPLTSTDLEDIVGMMVGLTDLAEEVQIGSSDRHREAKRFIDAFVARSDALDLVTAHSPGDLVSQRRAEAWLAAQRSR